MGHFADDKEHTLYDILFITVALLTGFFSAFTTYKGFSNNFDFFLSIIIAVIIGFGFFAINLKIRELRTNGQSILTALVIFFIFFVVSFISNTNAIYTFFIQNNITKKTQEKTWNVFDYNINVLEKTIRESRKQVDTFQQKRERIEALKTNLYNQITDPNRLGLGEKALEHLKNIETLLGVKLTRQKPPAKYSSVRKYKAYATNMNKQIDQLFNLKFQNPKEEIYNLLQNNIRQVHSKYYTINMRSSKEESYSTENTDDMIKEFNILKNQFIQYNINITDNFKEFDAKEDDIGSFTDTWYNIINDTNRFATFFAIFLSIMIDVMTPLLALLYKSEEGNIY